MQTFHADEMILKEGEVNDSMFKILSGSVAVFNRYGEKEEHLIGIYSKGRCFGELNVFSDLPCIHWKNSLPPTRGMSSTSWEIWLIRSGWCRRILSFWSMISRKRKTRIRRRRTRSERRLCSTRIRRTIPLRIWYIRMCWHERSVFRGNLPWNWGWEITRR